jgi:hypothetical protein
LCFLRRHRPTWALAAAGAVLLAGVDAFGSGDSPALARYAYWFGMMFLTAVTSTALLDTLEKSRTFNAHPLKLTATVLLVSHAR